MYGNRRSQSRLGFEQLEERALLAVTAIQDDIDGTVVINGQNAAEYVTVMMTDSNTWTVSEYSNFEQENAVYSGLLNEYTFNDVTGFDINLRGGDDALSLSGDGVSQLSGNLSITTGRGADFIEVLVLGIAGDVSINNGASDPEDAESILVAECNIVGSLAINGGNGTDLISVSSTSVGESVALFAGAGNDEVEIVNLTALEDVLIRLGNGDDVLTWNLAFDDDAVDVRGSLTIQAGGGADDIDIVGFGETESIDIVGGLNLLLGNELDTVDLGYINATSVSTIAGGAGNEIVNINNSAFEELEVRMGAGDDTVSIVNVSGSLLAVGGTGVNDSLTIESSSLVAIVRSFETYENDSL